ncbi:hypothetical protein MNBD_GAMMA06-1216 [hydrothermal vent metagenome]|uniref:VapC toxin protein n=1 Tax=hydrothermal vent metagenome TaxID=652676 RepID=A0A3B0WP59_9ZZZZ
MYMLDANICISSSTYGELCFGIESGNNNLKAERWRQLEIFTQKLLIGFLDESAGKYYGSIRVKLKKMARIIGNNTPLITAHTRSVNAVLVTNNVREFNRVPNLVVENWISD